jgi:hypothetical protein
MRSAVPCCSFGQSIGHRAPCCDTPPGRHGFRMPIIVTTRDVDALRKNGGLKQPLAVSASCSATDRLRTGAASIQTICARANLTWALPCQALSISYVNERAFQARLESFWNQKNIPSWLPLTHHSRGGLEHDNLCFISLQRTTRHDLVARQIPTPLPFPNN